MNQPVPNAARPTAALTRTNRKMVLPSMVCVPLRALVLLVRQDFVQTVVVVFVRDVRENLEGKSEAHFESGRWKSREEPVVITRAAPETVLVLVERETR